MTGLNVPLAVRLAYPGTRRSERITRLCRGLSFSAVDLGGYEVCEVTLDRRVDRPLPLIERPGTLLVVEDTRTGEIAFEGDLTDPGREVGSGGSQWRLKATGAASRLGDDESPVGLITRSIDRFTRSGQPAGRVEIVDAGSGPELRVFVPRGVVAGTTWFTDVTLPLHRDDGQRLARIDGVLAAGVTDANWRLQLFTMPSVTLVREFSFNTTPQGASPRLVGTHFPATDTYVILRVRRVTSSITVADDTTWGSIRGFYAEFQRTNAAGVVLGAASYLGAPSDPGIIEHLIGVRSGGALRLASPSLATRQTWGHLDYPDGATGDRIASEVAAAARRQWAVWGRDDDGLWEVFYRDLPTEIRYVCRVDAGLSSPGSLLDAWSAARVRYRDEGGALRSTLVTANPAPAALAGRSRTKLLDVGDEKVGAAATLAGQAFLAEHTTPPNGGTLTIAGLVWDRLASRWVPPWLLRPGELYLARDIQARADVLNAEGLDGVTVFRGRRVAFDAGRVAAQVDLDAAPTRLSEQIAETQKALANRPRR